MVEDPAALLSRIQSIRSGGFWPWTLTWCADGSIWIGSGACPALDAEGDQFRQ